MAAAGDRQGESTSRAERLDELSIALEEFHELLDNDEGLDAALNRLVAMVQRTIGDASVVSVTVVADGRVFTAAATDEAVIAIDRDQYAAGDGPCLRAAAERRTIRVTLPEARDRWPNFARAAEVAGMHAYLSAPLVLDRGEGGDSDVVGALNLYGREHTAFDALDEALITLFAAAASTAIVTARRYLHFRDLAEQMKTALISRAEIDQAKGVLMAAHGLTAEQAFEVLRRQSQDTNTKLRDVARALLASLSAAAEPRDSSRLGG
nr:GAF and ANTAR domain-containing protein [Actinomadura coerulea]